MIACSLWSCETWSLKLTEQLRIRSIKSKVVKYRPGLRGIYLQNAEEKRVIEFGVHKFCSF